MLASIYGLILVLSVSVGTVNCGGASYAIGFMNITTDTAETGFVQILIVAANETMVRIQSVGGSGYDNFTQIPGDNKVLFNATLKYGQLKVSSPMSVNQHSTSQLGLLISASTDINVFGVKSDLGTTDGFFALPLTADSKEFFVVGWPCDDALYFGALQVVAAADDTCVEVYRVTKGVYKLLDSFYLSQFDVLTYSLGVHDPNNATQPFYEYDVTGTFVNTSKPVAVYGGHSCALVPSPLVPFCDHIVEQIPPLSELGRTHIVPPIVGRQDSAGYVVRVVPTKDRTTIFYISPTGDTFGTTTRSAGDYLQLWSRRSSLPLLVTCSYRCVVMQYNTGRLSPRDQSLDIATDPFMLLVTPNDHFTESTGFTTSNFCDSRRMVIDFSSFVSIIIQKNFTQQVFLDGRRLTSWEIFFDEYAVASAPIKNGAHSITTWPPAMFGAYVYGHALAGQSASGYGYTAAFKVKGTLVSQNWEASVAVLQQRQADTLTASCAQENVLSGSLVATHTVLSSSAVLRYSFQLEVRPVQMSVTSLSAVCRETYRVALLAQFTNLTRIVNSLICSKLLCANVGGLDGAGVNIDNSPGSIVGNQALFVAIDASVDALQSAVTLEFDTVTGLVTGIVVTVPYVGLLDTYSTEFAYCRLEVREYLRQFGSWPLGGDLVPDLTTSGCGRMSFTTTEFATRKTSCQSPTV